MTNEQPEQSEATSEPSASSPLAAWMHPPQPTSGNLCGSERQVRIGQKLGAQPVKVLDGAHGVPVHRAGDAVVMSYEQAMNWIYEPQEG